MTPVYDVLFFFVFVFVFFVNRFFCVFSREFQHNSIKSVQCVPLDFFFLRDHRKPRLFQTCLKYS